MVTTRSQARKDGNESKPNSESETHPAVSKGRRTRKNISENASKDSKFKVSKSKGKKSKATKFKTKELKTNESEVEELEVEESEGEETEANEEELEANKAKATKFRVVNSKGKRSKSTNSRVLKSKATKPSGSPCCNTRLDGMFSRLPTDIYTEICSQATEVVYKPIPGITFASWLCHEYGSGIAAVNHRMRSVAPQQLSALNWHEKAMVYIHFDELVHLPRLLHLISQAYVYCRIWLLANPSTNPDDPDWLRVRDSYTFSVTVAAYKYCNPWTYGDVYEKLAMPNTGLDMMRRHKLRMWKLVEARTSIPELQSDEMNSLRDFVGHMVERMLFPRTLPRGELEVRVVLRDFTAPDWKIPQDTAVASRKQFLRLLFLLKNHFRRDLLINFVIVDSQRFGGQPNFDGLSNDAIDVRWIDTIEAYRSGTANLQSSDPRRDEPFEVQFERISRAKLERVLSCREGPNFLVSVR